MSAMINSVLTNQFFLMFLAIATGLLIGKIKIGSFSLGVSGGIFTGIVIGYFVTKWAHTEVLQYSEKDPFYRCGCTGFLYFLSAAFSCFHRNEGRRKYRCHF